MTMSELDNSEDRVQVAVIKVFEQYCPRICLAFTFNMFLGMVTLAHAWIVDELIWQGDVPLSVSILLDQDCCNCVSS